ETAASASARASSSRFWCGTQPSTNSPPKRTTTTAAITTSAVRETGGRSISTCPSPPWPTSAGRLATAANGGDPPATVAGCPLVGTGTGGGDRCLSSGFLAGMGHLGVLK